MGETETQREEGISGINETGTQSATVTILPDPEEGPVTPAGPLRSVQEAEIELPPEELARLWGPTTLERLARAYWRYLNRISLGLLRVGYSNTGRFVVLGWRRLVLLRFRPPEFDTGLGFGRVTWPIERGVLVSAEGRGRGYLQIDVRRLDDVDGGDMAKVRVRATVANFYPFLRGSGVIARIGSWFYSQTQLRIHVLVTRGFLKSLASGDLPPLRPGRESAYDTPED
jgi:hypothetical protein